MATASSTQAFLTTLPLFADFTREELEELTHLVRPLSIPVGAKLFTQGDPPDGMFLVASGSIAVTARVPGDARVSLATCRSGEILGEAAILDGGVRSATAEAVEASEVLFFGSRLLSALRLDHRPGALKLINRVARVVANRVRSTAEGLNPTPATQRSAELGRVERRAATGLTYENLRVLPLFKSLSREETQELLEMCPLADAEKGATLCVQGSATNTLRIVTRGAIQERREHSSGYQRLFIVGPGRISGAIEAFSGQPATFTSIAREYTLFLELPFDKFQALQSRGSLGPKLYEAAVHDLMHALRRLGQEKSRLAIQGQLDVIGPGMAAEHGL